MYNSEQLGRLSDRDLLAEARAYEAHITANGSSLNLGGDEPAKMKEFNNTLEATLDQKDSLENQLDGLMEKKEIDVKNVLDELRRQRNVLYADDSLSDSALAAAGLPPRDAVKTASAAPTTAPIGWIDFAKLKHTIHFRDSSTPDRKAKPDGMQGCEIWHFIGATAPSSADEYDYLATDSNSPYIVFYEAENAGKKVFYQLRWLSKSGERGEWSETIEATING